MVWARLLAHIAGTVNQELLLKNEYLAAENRILRAQIKTRLVLSHAEKATLAEIGRRLGRKALEEIAVAAKPDTILGWFPEARGQEVRWIEIPSTLRPTQHRCGKRRIKRELHNIVTTRTVPLASRMPLPAWVAAAGGATPREPAR